jgi:hypothetical protein
MMAWLQHPEFLYRIEAQGPRQLNQFEIATRISFLITGANPDSALLDAADANQLSSEMGRIQQAKRLLSLDLAQKNIAAFHSQWLGYSNSVFPSALESALAQETTDLINRVIFETDSDWLKLFTWHETRIDSTLAQHYGLPSPGQNKTWVSYPPGRAAGLLSQASLARLGAKFSDTSPTLRGYELYKRLFCGEFKAVIPPGVDVDTPPGNPTDCKIQRYGMRNMTSCVACHGVTDNIGFGLEKIGAFGEWRTTEPGLPSCVLQENGTFDSQPFQGPEGFAKLVAQHPKTSACATKQLFEFFVGRRSTNDDQETLLALQGQYYQSRSLKSLLEALVKSPAISYKGE